MKNCIRIAFVVIVISSFTGKIGNLYSQDNQRLPARTGYFLAVGTDNGSNGIIYISFDGTTWTSIQHGSMEQRSPFSICTANDKVYIGFDDGTILDASSWETVKRGGYILRGASCSDEVYVAVGESGGGKATVLWSRDCQKWTAVVLDERELAAVAYGNGIFVAVGFSGLCLTSKDGIHWSKEKTIDRNNFLSIIFHDGRFYAAGSRNAQFISRDGKNWSAAPIPHDEGGYSSWKSIAFGRDRIVAAGLFQPAAVFKKTGNGLSFVKSSSGSPTLNGVTYGNSIFVGCGLSGQVSWSSDGEKWNTSKIGGETLNSVAFGKGIFVMVGDGGSIRTSRDGIKWRTVMESCNSSLASVAFLKDRFIAVGANGRHLWSSDGAAWFDDYAESFGVYSLAYGNGKLVAAGSNGGRACRADGTTGWIPIPGVSMHSFHGLEYGNNRFVAVGSNYFGGGGRVVWSPDGLSWQNDVVIKERFGYLAFGNDRFVAVGADGSTGWSNDGVKWHTARHGGYWNNIIFGNGVFLALHHNKLVYISRDGVSWDSYPMPAGDELVTAAWGKDLFVAGGANNRIVISKNGTTWQPVTLPQSYDKRGNKTTVIFHEIRYIR
mgnify:CR=1 FL=1